MFEIQKRCSIHKFIFNMCDVCSSHKAFIYRYQYEINIHSNKHKYRARYMDMLYCHNSMSSEQFTLDCIFPFNARKRKREKPKKIQTTSLQKLNRFIIFCLFVTMTFVAVY